MNVFISTVTALAISSHTEIFNIIVLGNIPHGTTSEICTQTRNGRRCIVMETYFESDISIKAYL